MMLRSGIGMHSSKKIPVAHLVVLPNYHEDEAVFREALEHLDRFPSAERDTFTLVWAVEAREGPNTQDKAECPQRRLATSSRT